MKTAFTAFLAALVLNLFSTQAAHAGEVVVDSSAPAKQHFVAAKTEIEAMLAGRQPLSYERAIYLIENAYWGGSIDFADFTKALDVQAGYILTVLNANRNQKGYVAELGWMETEADRKRKYDKALANFAIFTYLTDTTFFFGKDGKMWHHMPVRYTNRDPLGSIAWTNTQVTNLLQNGHGNCFSLASLYYIFSERLSADAKLCTAPGHLYINHPDDKGTRFNLELSNGTFPGNGTIITLSYSTMEAVKNGIALRELNRKQAVALTLVYLAKGYAHKFGTNGNQFALSCAESALRADSLNLNAMLLKAEVLEERILTEGTTIVQLQNEVGFKDYERLLAELYELGYREMPLEMKNIMMAGYQKDTLPYKRRNHTSQPFKKYGMENDRHASLSWGLFEEMHEAKPIERYGRTLFDTKLKRVRGFVEEEILYNGYDFDPVTFAWNVDPLAHKAPHSSPYAFCEGNPILHLDPDGRFKLNYNDKILEANGLTKLDVQRFESIIQNMSQLINDNPAAMQAIINSTGFSEERIRSDFTFGQGPDITIAPIYATARADASGIVFHPDAIKTLASIDSKDREHLSSQTLGIAITTGHEYVHYGDHTTNGARSGQWSLYGNKVVSHSEPYNGGPPRDPGSLRIGKQYWKMSPSGHRGTDFEIAGFGIRLATGSKGEFIFEKASFSNLGPNSPIAAPSIPNDLQGSGAADKFKVE